MVRSRISIFSLQSSPSTKILIISITMAIQYWFSTSARMSAVTNRQITEYIRYKNTIILWSPVRTVDAVSPNWMMSYLRVNQFNYNLFLSFPSHNCHSEFVSINQFHTRKYILSVTVDPICHLATLASCWIGCHEKSVIFHESNVDQFRAHKDWSASHVWEMSKAKCRRAETNSTEFPLGCDFWKWWTKGHACGGKTFSIKSNCRWWWG